jgi:hypothetical protein
MRQQNNGRRRQNRGSNRRSYGGGNNNGNINKNTVIDSSGPDGRQRGSVSQLNEKYTSLASDAASSDDRILAESYLQFADHYYRINKEIEINIEAKEAKLNIEKDIHENSSSEVETENNDKNDKNENKKLPRRKRGFQIRENELLTQVDNNKTTVVNENNNLEKVSSEDKSKSLKKDIDTVENKNIDNETDLLI